MRLATWNINSVRVRSQRAVELLERHDIDVLALQETKIRDADFPSDVFESAGYRVATNGCDQWNGVALLSRIGLEDVRYHFPHQPAFTTGERECRAIAARCDGVDVWSLYVPHGRSVDHEHYAYKLRFLSALAGYAKEVRDRDTPSVFVGDFNVAPLDTDVWDRAVFNGATHVTPAERQLFDAVCASAPEVTRQFTHGHFTCWDYTNARFQKNEGLCIDFQLATRRLAAVNAWVDKAERSGRGASDHAPVIVDYVMQ